MNKLIEIQDMIYNQIKRLDNDDLMKTDLKSELSRGNIISNNAATYLKAVNTGLSIKNTATRTGQNLHALQKELGIVANED